MENTTNALPEGSSLRGKAFTYKIAKFLGQGSFGITYLATIQTNDKSRTLGIEVKVAIKEFFMEKINGREHSIVTIGTQQGIYSEYKKKFLREANNLAKMRHQHIVSVLEAFEANNTVYYAMEYLDGGSLDKHIEKHGGLEETETIQCAKEIGDALSYMHQNNMLHLDLKPSNVMRRKNGELVLIDFGLSKQYNDNGEPESSTNIGGGTLGYAPIEQANYQEGKGFPVTMDIYALGGTMYKMLTGIRPPEASEILNDGFPYIELSQRGVSKQTADCIQKAMCPLKKDRYQSVRDFINHLPIAVNTIENFHGSNLIVSQTEVPDISKTGPIYLTDLTSLIEFSYHNTHSKPKGFKKYTIKITSQNLHVNTESVTGSQTNMNYFYSAAKLYALIQSINTLQLYALPKSNINNQEEAVISLKVYEPNGRYINASTDDKGKALLSGDKERLREIIEVIAQLKQPTKETTINKAKKRVLSILGIQTD